MLTALFNSAMTVGDVVRRWRLKQGWSQARLAKEMGISVQQISNLETGVSKTLKLSNAKRMSEITGLDFDVVFPRDDDQTSDLVQMKNLPFFDAKLPASGWTEAETRDQPDGFATVPVNTPPDAFCLRIFGHCMEPKFPSGAVVVFIPIRDGENGAAQYEDGKAYYFQHSDGMATFKNVFYEPDMQRFRLEPINKEYKTLYVPEQMKARMSRAIKWMMIKDVE